MKKTFKLLIKIFLVLLLLAIIVGGYFGYQTLKNQGEDAVAMMTEPEKEYLEKVNMIKKGMSHDDLIAILGEPDKEAYPTYAWTVNEDNLSQLVVTFDRHGVSAAIWVKTNKFTYAPSLEAVEGSEETKKAEEN